MARTTAKADPAFVAELAELTRQRREEFLSHRGDGQAVVSRGWMSWTGERKTPAKPLEPWFDAQAYRLRTAEIHGPHTMDSPCLESVESVPDVRNGVTTMVAEPGWFKCQLIGIHLHDHEGRLYAHGVVDRNGCPKRQAVPA